MKTSKNYLISWQISLICSYHSGRKEIPFYLHSPFMPFSCPCITWQCPLLSASGVELSHYAVSLSCDTSHQRRLLWQPVRGPQPTLRTLQCSGDRGHNSIDSLITVQCEIWTLVQKQGELEIGKTLLMAQSIVKIQTRSTGFVQLCDTQSISS